MARIEATRNQNNINATKMARHEWCRAIIHLNINEWLRAKDQRAILSDRMCDLVASERLARHLEQLHVQFGRARRWLEARRNIKYSLIKWMRAKRL